MIKPHSIKFIINIVLYIYWGDNTLYHLYRLPPNYDSLIISTLEDLITFKLECLNYMCQLILQLDHIPLIFFFWDFLDYNSYSRLVLRNFIFKESSHTGMVLFLFMALSLTEALNLIYHSLVTFSLEIY